MSDEPIQLGADYGSKDSTVLGGIRRDGVRWIYTLEKGETAVPTDRGFIVCHPDRPPKLITADGIEEIKL